MLGFGRQRPSPEGTVVKAGDGLLILTGKDGKERTVAVAPDAEILLNGAACKLEELPVGVRAKLTPRREAGRPVIVRVEAATA
jgi:hypothetical protein